MANWPPVSMTTIDAEEQHVDRDAPEVAAHDRPADLGAAGEVAEVEHEGAVDGHPERGAAEDLPPHLAAGRARSAVDQAIEPPALMKHPSRPARRR